MSKPRSPKAAKVTHLKDGLTPEQQSEQRIKELKNKERAFIAASRRKDRSFDKRLKSALEASAVHKELTGKGLKITEEVILNDELYEEEEDERTRAAHYRHRMSLQHPQLGLVAQHPVDEEFARIYPSISSRRLSWHLSMQENPDFSQGPRPSFAHHPSQHGSYTSRAAPSYDIRRSGYSAVKPLPQQSPVEHPARYRRASAGALPANSSPRAAPAPITAPASVVSDDSFSPFSNPGSNPSSMSSPRTESDTASLATSSNLTHAQQLPLQVHGDFPTSLVDLPMDYVMVDQQNIDLGVQQSMDSMGQYDDLFEYNFSMTPLGSDPSPETALPPPVESDSFDEFLVNWDSISEGTG
ncbi:hypothetical protein QBC38DRAFT_179044 [Podospora fimiseda]|uniref:Uncharacterized protein n=1 Tax=Podospora fimiseda TaxID=252190 RepID=A0AAN7H8E3_9PEZI|nr:hypothetical protein QBC38DRAFT_179044 [Podospora fimiseda]